MIHFGRTDSRLVPLLLCVLCGCSKPTHPEKPPVIAASGQVLLAGKPLAGATVTFLSLDGKVSSTGVTDDGGEFILSTYDQNDGAPPGQYKVIVSVDDLEVSAEGKPVPKANKRVGPPVPEKYSRPADSPLSAEITGTGPNRFRFPLN